MVIECIKQVTDWIISWLLLAACTLTEQEKAIYCMGFQHSHNPLEAISFFLASTILWIHFFCICMHWTLCDLCKLQHTLQFFSYVSIQYSILSTIHSVCCHLVGSDKIDSLCQKVTWPSIYSEKKQHKSYCFTQTIVWLSLTRKYIFGFNAPGHCLFRVRM